MSKSVHVIGGGLAGCEAAVQAASFGVPVILYEMKPYKKSPAHQTDGLGELVCSNSFKAMEVSTASGLLKKEMELLGSIALQCAQKTSVAAGGALAVDREAFSQKMTAAVSENPHIKIVRKEVVNLREIPDGETVIVATGPLTSEALSQSIAEDMGRPALSFFDAAAPILYKDSIDMTVAYKAARYHKGTSDYINCPMNEKEYTAFYQELIRAETAPVHQFEESALYEGCMPIESMARRGVDTIRFGPLKPVGLDRPDGSKNYAVVQLRQDNQQGTLYNLVGFQTRLKFGEQKRVFSMIPGLAQCEFARYGVMHRNTYIQSPGLLDRTYRVLSPAQHGWGNRTVFFAGQLTGVEGYMESANSGLTAGINGAMAFLSRDPVIFPRSTATGALAAYVSEYAGKDFQPMGINFGIIEEPETILQMGIHKKDKKKRRELLAALAVERIGKAVEELHV